MRIRNISGGSSPISRPTSIPRGLNEDVIRLISAKKQEPEWLLEWRLKAYRHWLTMKEPTWANVHYPTIDYQDIIYYSAPKAKKDGPKSLDEVDPELLKTYDKLGIPLQEQEILAGVAVDAVFDSVSVATTFKEQAEGPWGSSSARSPRRCASIPTWCGKYLGSVVPYVRQFLRGAELGGLQRRLVLLRAQGRALPHGAFHLLPHQRQGHRAVRAHPDRGR